VFLQAERSRLSVDLLDKHLFSNNLKTIIRSTATSNEVRAYKLVRHIQKNEELT